MNRLIVALLAAAWAASPALAEPATDDRPAAQAPAPGAASFDESAPTALEVKRAPTGHVLVRCSVNGSEPGWFIFDTGAGISLISTPHVEPLGLRAAGQIEAVGIGGGEAAGLVAADSLAVGPLTLRDNPMLVTDLSFLKPHLGEEIQGVLGYGVLARCVAEIDLAEPAVRLHRADESGLASLPWEELVLIGRVPAVHARFEDHEGVFRLDTGANGSVTFHEPAVRSLGLLEGRDVGDAKVGGVGGFVAAKSGELAWFEIGGVRTDGVAAMFAVEPKGSFADGTRAGNIGVDLLKPFVMYFDYAGARVAFVPRAGG